MTSKNIVVIGGSAAGLASAVALAEQGHRITILEKEVLPPCRSAVEAFERWPRRTAPQIRHSHAFLARLHNLIRERTPRLYDRLLAAGAEPMRFHDMVRELHPSPELLASDDEIVLLGCRRMTFDWVVRGYVEDEGLASYRDGTEVIGLEATREGSDPVPRVTGVRVRDAAGGTALLPADLVVEASGRRSQLATWLEAIGTRPLEMDQESCGIFYSSRFYRIRDGVETPAMEGPIGADLGYMKYGIFLGDSRIFSITLAAAPDDDDMRAVIRQRAFEAATSVLPATMKWVDPAVSEPITEVYNFADLRNTLRHFVADGEPLALSIFPVGDSLVHANPLSGRGCTLAWLGAYALADALREHPRDPRDFALALHERIVRDLVPWYENMRDQDRESIRVREEAARGRDPYAFEREDGSVDPRAYMRSLVRDGLVPALAEDLVVLRAFMRTFNMLDRPSDMLRQPDLLGRVLAVWKQRHERERRNLGPERTEMVEHIRRAAA